MSDAQRYKQMGNAVTVNVIEAVAGRLPADPEVKAAIMALIAHTPQAAVVAALEKLKQVNGSVIGMDGRRVDNMVHRSIIDEHIARAKEGDK